MGTFTVKVYTFKTSLILYFILLSGKEKMFAFLIIWINADIIILLISFPTLNTIRILSSWSMKSSYITDDNVTENTKANQSHRSSDKNFNQREGLDLLMKFHLQRSLIFRMFRKICSMTRCHSCSENEILVTISQYATVNWSLQFRCYR